MKRLLLGLLLSVMGIGSVWGESLILPSHIWDSQGYMETPADPEDPKQLMLAALYHFNIANRTEGIKNRNAAFSNS